MQPLLNKLFKNRSAIEEVYANNGNKDFKRHRQEKAKNEQKALKTWYTNARNNDARLSGPLLMQKAQTLAAGSGRKF